MMSQAYRKNCEGLTDITVFSLIKEGYCNYILMIFCEANCVCVPPNDSRVWQSG